MAEYWLPQTRIIVAKSSRGELLSTEAELARREGRSYEPASILLERIKEERDTASQQVSKKRRRQVPVET